MALCGFPPQPAVASDIQRLLPLRRMGADRGESADEKLAVNLRALRDGAGLSQGALAAAMTERGWPWHQSTVYRVESGRQGVKFAEAVDLAGILGTSLDRLTWSSAEAAQAEFVRAAGAAVRLSAETVSAAVRDLLSAVSRAERVLAEAAGSDLPRVAAARDDTAARVADFGLEEAVAEGIRRHQARGHEEDGDGGQQEG
jgi:transcriptional regulator with XRE-family HTH domain